MSATVFVSTEVNPIPITFARRWFQVFVRITWKETRVVWPLLSVVAAMMAGLAGLVAWALRDQVQDALGALYAIVILFPLLFALGCGGMSYAGEREDGTWDWLRRIAAPPSAVCAAKIVVGLICAVLLTMVAWWALVRFAWRPELERSAVDASHRRLMVLLIGVSSTLLVSQIVSSLIKNVFVALIVSGVVLAPVLTAGLALGTDHTGHLFGPGINDVNFAPVWIGWIAAVLGLMACEFSLADCWLKDMPPWRAGLIGLLVNPSDRQRLLLSVLGYHKNPLTHLMAREWSLARPWLWSIGLTLAIPIWLATASPNQWYRWSGSYAFVPLLFIGTWLLALVPALMGVWAYHPDQTDLRFRFLADRGISPALIWMSKHLVRVPILLLLVLTSAVMGIFGSVVLGGRLEIPVTGWIFGAILAFAVMSYAAGQLIGQLIRSPITSSFLAAVFTLLLALWTHSLRLLDLPFVFDLVPIAILFAASWLRSRDWLLERSSWRARLQLAASLIIPFALLYGAVGWYRTLGLPQVARIPPTRSEVKPQRLQTVEAKQRRTQASRDLRETYERELAEMAAELKPIRERLAWQFWPHSRGELPGAPIPGFGAAGGSGLTSASSSRGDQPEAPIPDRNPLTRAEALQFAETLFPDFSPQELMPLIGGFDRDLVHELDDSGMPHHRNLLDRLYGEPRNNPSLFDRLLSDLHLKHFTETRKQFLNLTRDGVSLGDLAPIPALLGVQSKLFAEREEYASALEITWALERYVLRSSSDGVPTNRGLNSENVNRLLELASRCRESRPIAQVIRELQAIEISAQSHISAILELFAAVNDPDDDVRLIAGLGTSEPTGVLVSKSPYAPVLMKLFPWELSVARREINVELARELAVLEAVEAVIRHSGADLIRWQPAASTLRERESERGLPAIPEFDLPINSSSPLTTVADVKSQSFLISPRTRGALIASEIERRQVVLLLALLAWRNDHGGYPDRLEQLAGPLLDKVPLDPMTGESFEYTKSVRPAITAPSARKLQSHAAQLRVRSLDGQRDMWIEVWPRITTFRLTQ